MERVEIEKRKKELNEILKEGDVAARLKKLEVLAKEVGASVTRMGDVQIGHNAARVFYEQRNIITEAEIVHNIQESLQTHIMINMSKTASRNFWIALTSVIIALLAMVAAWSAVIVNFVGCGG